MHKKTYCSHSLFTEESLIDFIKYNGKEGKCSYTNTTDTVIEVDHVAKYIKSCIQKKYEDAANSVSYQSSEGGYQLPTYTIRDILIDHHFIMDFSNEAEEQVFKDIIKVIDDNTPYVRKYPYGPPSGAEKGIYSWNSFSDLIKNEQRYTSFYGLSQNNILEYNPLKNFLTDISHIFADERITKTLEIGEIIYRARVDNQEKLTLSDLSAPPPKQANHNRFSPEGISFFYGALEKDTCIAEIRPSLVEKVAVGKFKTTQKLFIADFVSGLGKPSSIFEKTYEFNKDEFLIPFLNEFIKEISKPIRPNDSKFDYIPTQAFVECLRFVLDLSIDGIIFKSSIKSKGKNLVLFGDEILTNKTSDSCLKAVGLTRYSIKKIKYQKRPLQ